MRAIAGILVLVLLAAGCLAPQGSETPAATEAAPASSPLNATAADWFEVPLQPGPAGDLAAFWFELPNGSLHPASPSSRMQEAILEVAVVTPEGADANLTDRSIFVFVPEKGKLALLSAFVSTTGTLAVGGLELGAPRAMGPSPAPFFVGFGTSDLHVGQKLALVVATKANASAPARLLFRALDHPLARQEKPSPDAASFVAARNGTAPIPIPLAARGHGIQVAQMTELDIAVPPSFLRYESRTPALKEEGGVSPDARPVAAKRAQSWSASTSDAEGWTFLAALAIADNAVGEWSLTRALHGPEAVDGGRIVTTSVVPTSLVLGYPLAWHVADGVGPAKSTLRLDETRAGTVEIILYDQVDLGTSLATLFGMPGAPLDATGGGLLLDDGLELTQGYARVHVETPGLDLPRGA